MPFPDVEWPPSNPVRKCLADWAEPQGFLPSERWGDSREVTLLRAEAELRAQVASLADSNAAMTEELLSLRSENETLRLCKLQVKIDETKLMTDEWAETLAQTTVEREKLKDEVVRLRLEIIRRDVERQRLCITGKERDVLDEAKEFFLAIYRNHNGPKNAAIIQGLIDRLPGDAT